MRAYKLLVHFHALKIVIVIKIKVKINSGTPFPSSKGKNRVFLHNNVVKYTCVKINITIKKINVIVIISLYKPYFMYHII